jgi:hypothetical protein
VAVVAVTVHRLSLYRSDDPYTRVPNVTVNDKRLDLKARGLLLFMLSKPDGWTFRERTLADHCGVSRAQIRTAMQTLITHGYVKRNVVVVDGLPRQQTEVYDVATDEGSVSVPPLVSNPDRPEPVPVSNTESAVKLNPTGDRKQDVLFDAVCEVCGHDPSRLTGSERGRINRALKDLRSVGATPEQVRAAAGRWRATYPNATLTANALAVHWSKLTAITKTATQQADPELERIREQQRAEW